LQYKYIIKELTGNYDTSLCAMKVQSEIDLMSINILFKVCVGKI